MASEISRLYDFQPGSRASSDQVDSEFNQLVTAYNTLNGEVIALIALLDSATGATTIGATPVPDLDGSTVQALIESIRNKLKSITDGDSGADFIGSTPLKAGGSSTVQGQLKELYVEESLRVQNENIRKSNETARITAENIRKSNETARITAEDIRQDNEEARQEADILRGQTVEAIEQHYAPRLTTVEGQINNLDAQKAEKTEVNATNLRIDNLVIPISPENVNVEVTDAHNSIVKNKNFASLKDRFEESEQDLETHKSAYASQRLQDQLKVATIEKDLNDYKKTLSQVNVNQEAKQTATGYGVVSLPKNAANGQFSASVKGLTATNLIENGDFSKTFTEFWDTNTTGLTIEDGVVTYTSSQSQWNAIMTKKQYNIYANHKYYISAKYKSNTPSSNESSNILYIYPYLGSAYIPFRDYANINQWMSVSGIISPTENGMAEVKLRNGYFDGTVSWQKPIFINLTQTFGAGNEPTKEQCDKMFANWFDGTKSTVGAGRVQSTDDVGNVISELYYVAKDPNTSEIIKLKSVPSANDEIRVSGGEAELVKRVGKLILNGEIEWTNLYSADTTTYRITAIDFRILHNIPPLTSSNSIAASSVISYKTTTSTSENNVNKVVVNESTPHLYIRILKSIIDNVEGITTIEKIKNYLNQYPITLTYQLAEPIITPVQVSGTLVSYPSGTVYIEPFVADAGIYVDKMEVLHSDLPIKALEKISKVDFNTGLETELDITAAVIAEDKLSFTHPDLTSGDIVFFTYEYDRESTVGETEIEYYDSRYVIKDSVTGKFYKWHLAVADGVPSIKLTEV